MCIFGHKFGLVQTDGFQYCSKCGNAQQPSIPHPCVNGHLWVDEYEQRYTNTNTCGLTGGIRQYTSIEYFQECSRCGKKRSIEI